MTSQKDTKSCVPTVTQEKPNLKIEVETGISQKEDRMATEDRLNTQIEQDNDALIAEMLRSAEKVELPSELTREPVIHGGDAVLPSPMTVKEISSAGYVWVFDTRSFERIPILYYMLPNRLRERRPDGSFRFTTVDPGQKPKRGTIKCMLHADDPNRAHYNELGFRVCPRECIPNPYQLKQHMRKKHPQEWAAIEEERMAKEREEDRMLQRLLIKQQLEKQGGGVKEVEPAQEPEQAPPKTAERVFSCRNCGIYFGAEKPRDEHEKICGQ